MEYNPTILTRDRLYLVQSTALQGSIGEPGRLQPKHGYAYFMEQGLGKTLTVLQEFHELVTHDLVDISVLVVPRSLRGNWQEEMEEWGYPYPVVLMENEKKCLAELNELRKSNNPFRRNPMVVMHYEQVKTHGQRILSRLIDMGKRVYLALDESVRIKKHNSVNGDILYLLASGQERYSLGGKKKGIRKVNDGVSFVRVLSGTPAPQGPHDLWSQFRLIGLMEKTPYFAFKNTYCKLGGYEGKKIVGAQNLDILRLRTGHAVFRAKKKDWTDLPEKIWMKPRDIELTEAQRKAYREIANEFVLELGPDDFVTVEMAITVKNKLQQIASGWIFDNEKNVRELVPFQENPKLNETRDVIEQVTGAGGKLLVFYFFKPSRRYLEMLAEDMSIKAVFLESGLKDAEFQARKKQFNEDDDTVVAFCQTDAVKEGHTLLGTKARPCHNTLFFENTYSLYARAQGEDRNHRHGQLYPVVYHDLAASKEDRAIIKALQKKADLQEAVLGEFQSYNPNFKLAVDDTGELFDL